jgi:hypothetical protein
LPTPWTLHVLTLAGLAARNQSGGVAAQDSYIRRTTVVQWKIPCNHGFCCVRPRRYFRLICEPFHE